MDKLKKYFLIITFAAPFLSALLFTNNVLAWEFPKELKNTADKEFHVEEYKESNKISTESITDPDRKIRKAFKVFSVPTAVLLKKENEQWIAKKSYIGAEQIAQIESDLNKMSK